MSLLSSDGALLSAGGVLLSSDGAEEFSDGSPDSAGASDCARLSEPAELSAGRLAADDMSEVPSSGVVTQAPSMHSTSTIDITI